MPIAAGAMVLRKSAPLLKAGLGRVRAELGEELVGDEKREDQNHCR